MYIVGVSTYVPSLESMLLKSHASKMI
jgi:hypothetical protein